MTVGSVDMLMKYPDLALVKDIRGARVPSGMSYATIWYSPSLRVWVMWCRGDEGQGSVCEYKNEQQAVQEGNEYCGVVDRSRIAGPWEADSDPAKAEARTKRIAEAVSGRKGRDGVLALHKMRARRGDFD